MRGMSYLLGGALVAVISAGLIMPSLTSAQEAAKEATKAAAFKYVGAQACKACHMGEKNGKIWETYLESPHAKAFEKLPEASRANAACLGCHTTGHGKEIAKGKTAADLQGVQCEACHGPGSEYKTLAVMKSQEQSLAKGLIIPNEKVCAGCHTASIPKDCWAGAAAAPKFDFATAVKKVEHHIPKKP